MPFKIFISYSIKDSDIAKEIKKNIEQNRDVSIFLSEENLLLGHMDDAILKEIERCDLFLVLCSKNSHESHYVQNEIGAARGYGKTIVALLIDKNVKPDAMIQNINYLPIYDKEKFTAEMPKLYLYIEQQVQQRNDEINSQRSLNAFIIVGALVVIAMYVFSRNKE